MLIKRIKINSIKQFSDQRKIDDRMFYIYIYNKASQIIVMHFNLASDFFCPFHVILYEVSSIYRSLLLYYFKIKHVSLSLLWGPHFIKYEIKRTIIDRWSLSP
jgi:hypothetical protein